MNIRFVLIFVFFVASPRGFSQSYTHCDVYQFEGNDSSKKEVVLRETFNSAGLITSQIYSNYKTSAVSAGADGTYFYFYKDTLLVERSFVDEHGDRTKMLCHYNSKNQLIQQEHFDYKKRLRKDCNKGYGRPGGCIIRPGDYEKHRTWRQTSEVNYSYDAKGNKILYDATKLHFTTQNRFTWTYDSLGRVSTYSSYDDQRLIWIEKYAYFHNGYEFTRTWYDYYGNPEHLAKETWSYVPQYTCNFILDSNGRVLKETVTTEKGITASVENYTYDASGRLVRSVHCDGNGNMEVTHIYVYR